MFKFPRSPALALESLRFYSTSKPKTTVQLVSELRKLTNAPIIKARQALMETNNDFDAALKWLQEDLLASGAAKAEKIKNRQASEGLISINVDNGNATTQKAAIVELNCESDFVSRTDEFVRLAADIAQTVSNIPKPVSGGAFSPVDLATLLESPLVSTHKSGATVQSSITDLIARIGENITLRRAALLSPPASPGFRVASYLHNSIPNFTSLGRIGTIALLSYRSPRLADLLKEDAFLMDAEKLERAICRQIVGCNAHSVRDVEADEETVLYKQQFALLGGEQSGLPVRRVMDEWQKQRGLDGFEVEEFLRWEVGQSSR
ncbi:elongation factor ts [Moniliophthora roreri]|uniref:Elongation factor Ts, mitochondrial n=1 Tax=Moniliophthora roreri TaxID=221103 RepID=A0A0W0F1J1_MONRR|nr:elongation factor ts [Moniliophthora roreri]